MCIEKRNEFFKWFNNSFLFLGGMRKSVGGKYWLKIDFFSREIYGFLIEMYDMAGFVNKHSSGVAREMNFIIKILGCVKFTIKNCADLRDSFLKIM